MTVRQLDLHREENTRTIIMPDNSTRRVLMSADLWRLHDAIKVVEGMSETDIARFALEELDLQDEIKSFDEAYRCCTAFFAGRWTP